MLFLAATAAAAGDVEGDGNQIADLQALDIAALLDHLTGDLVAQHQTDLRGSTAAHHVLVGAADIGGNDFQDDPVLDLLAARVLHFRVVDLLYFDLARTEINHTTITRHVSLSFLVVNTRRDRRPRSLALELVASVAETAVETWQGGFRRVGRAAIRFGPPSSSLRLVG